MSDKNDDEIKKEEIEKVRADSENIPVKVRNRSGHFEKKLPNSEVCHLPEEAEKRRLSELPKRLQDAIQEERKMMEEVKSTLRSAKDYIVWLLLKTGQHLSIKEMRSIVIVETGKFIKEGTLWMALDKMKKSSLGKFLVSYGEGSSHRYGIVHPKISLIGFEEAINLADTKDIGYCVKVKSNLDTKIEAIIKSSESDSRETGEENVDIGVQSSNSERNDKIRKLHSMAAELHILSEEIGGIECKITIKTK